MSQLIDIQYRVDQLEGGKFEALCDAYLSLKENGYAYSFGMKSGTAKTKSGVPDSYIRRPDGKYIVIASTSEKGKLANDGTNTAFMKKARGDIMDCLDVAEKEIGLENLEKIIFCHTQGNLSLKNDQELHQICEEKNVPLELIGIEQLAQDLYMKYPRLAQDFLGVSVMPWYIRFPPLTAIASNITPIPCHSWDGMRS